MPSGFFIGGLGRGLVDGFQASEDLKLKKEMLKMQQKRLKLEEDEQIFKTNQMQRQVVDWDRQDKAIEEFSRISAGERPTQIETEAADPVVGAQAREAEPRDLRAAMIGMVPRAQLGTVVNNMMNPRVGASGNRVIGPNQVLTDDTGKVLFENQNKAPDRAPFSVTDRTYFEARNEGLSHEEAVKRAADARRSLSTASAQAPFDVKADPRNQQTQKEFNRAGAEGEQAGKPLEAGTRKELGALESAKRQLDIVKQNFDKNFLGPIKGTQAAYDFRRTAGSYIGQPVGAKEEQFRGALAKAREELIRAKEGAVIPAEMYNKLAGLLPKETDEPAVFDSAYNRFVKELDAAMGTTRTLGTTPRGAALTQPGRAPRILSITPVP